jgi:Tfp pilus tip-associated adhesin PilY1
MDMFKKQWVAKASLALSFLSLAVVSSMNAGADDTELFTQPPGATAPAPTVTFLLDNTSNWSRASQAWPDASTAGGAELASIATIASSVTKPINLGLAEFTSGGAYLRFGARPMYGTSGSVANAAAFADLLNSVSVNSPAEKINSNASNPEMGAGLYEIHKYYNGLTPYAGGTASNGLADYSTNPTGSPKTGKNEGLTSGWAYASAGGSYVAPFAAGDCGKKYVIMVVNNANGGYPTGAATYESASVTATTVAGSSTFIPSWAAYLYKNDNTVVYVLDAYNAQQNVPYSTMLAATAKSGGGRYFAVKSSSDIQTALTTIFNEIQSVNDVFAAAALPVSANVRGTDLNQVYLGVFRPDPYARPIWPGNLKEYSLGLDSTGNLQIVDSVGAVALSSTTGFAANGAISYWTSANNYWAFSPNSSSASPNSDSPDGPVVERGGANEILRWNTSTSATRSEASRTVYTYVGSSPGSAVDLSACSGVSCQFVDSNTAMTSVMFGASSAANRTAIIAWARGADLNDDNSDGSVADIRSTAHGDVIHSRPAVVNYNRYGDDNDVVVYYGSNDGLLHAVQGGTSGPTTTLSNGRPLGGQEYWAFAAQEFFSKMLRQYNNSPAITFNATSGSTTTAATAIVSGSGYGVINSASAGVRSGAVITGSASVPAGASVSGVDVASSATLTSAATADGRAIAISATISASGSFASGSANINLATTPTGLAIGQAVVDANGSLPSSGGYTIASIASGSGAAFSLSNPASASSGSPAGNTTVYSVPAMSVYGVLNSNAAAVYFPGLASLPAQITTGQSVAVGAGTGAFAASSTLSSISGTNADLATLSTGTVSAGYASNVIAESSVSSATGASTVGTGAAQTCASATTCTLNVVSSASLKVGMRVVLPGSTITPASSQLLISAIGSGTQFTTAASDGASFSATSITKNGSIAHYPRTLVNIAGQPLSATLGTSKLVLDGISSYISQPAPTVATMGAYLITAVAQPAFVTTLTGGTAANKPAWISGTASFTGSAGGSAGTSAAVPKLTVSSNPSTTGYGRVDFTTSQPTFYTLASNVVAMGTSGDATKIKVGMTVTSANVAAGTTVLTAAPAASTVITVKDSTGATWIPASSSASDVMTFSIPFSLITIKGSTSVGLLSGDPTTVPSTWTLSGTGISAGTTFTPVGAGALGATQTFVDFGVSLATGSSSPTLTYTVAPNGSGKPYFFDGPIGVYRHDANGDGKIVAGSCVAGDCDKAMIFVPMRRGGRMIYAFDVTVPAQPKLVWKKGCTDAGVCDSGWGEMGQSWSQPQTTTLADGTLGLIFGAGYDSPYDDNDPATSSVSRTMGRGVFVVNANTGAIIRVFSGVAGSASQNAAPSASTSDTPYMSCSVPGDVAILTKDPVTGQTRSAFRAYVGDTCGQMFRLDISNTDPSKWFATPLFSGGYKYWSTQSTFPNDGAKIPGGAAAENLDMQNRKFLFQMDVVYGGSDANGAFFYVLGGTGDREHPFNGYGDGSHPYSSTVVNRFYMVKDYNTATDATWAGSNPLVAPPGNPGRAGTGTPARNTFPVLESDLYDATTDAAQLGTSAQQTAALASLTSGGAGSVYNGWKITLDIGEKVVGSATTSSNYVFFGTNLPNRSTTSACTTNLGEARLYQVGIVNAGAAPSNSYSGAITSATQRYTVSPGGGLPPSPVPVAVVINGQYKEGIIVGTQMQSPATSTYGSRIRVYYKKIIDKQ